MSSHFDTKTVACSKDYFTLLDMSDCYTCSFTEFYPFCLKLYYFSNFKDFNTIALA